MGYESRQFRFFGMVLRRLLCLSVIPSEAEESTGAIQYWMRVMVTADLNHPLCPRPDCPTQYQRIAPRRFHSSLSTLQDRLFDTAAPSRGRLRM
jgi:hypothetical protein